MKKLSVYHSSNYGTLKREIASEMWISRRETFRTKKMMLNEKRFSSIAICCHGFVVSLPLLSSPVYNKYIRSIKRWRHVPMATINKKELPNYNNFSKFLDIFSTENILELRLYAKLYVNFMNRYWLMNSTLCWQCVSFSAL